MLEDLIFILLIAGGKSRKLTLAALSVNSSFARFLQLIIEKSRLIVQIIAARASIATHEIILSNTRRAINLTIILLTPGLRFVNQT